MLIHKLKPEQSIYIRGDVEIKNISAHPIKLGCIGSAEIARDAIDLVENPSFTKGKEEVKYLLTI